MRSRWTILAVLFTARTAMAVQFQTVGSVAPLFDRDLGIGLADVGILIGLYFAPGIVIALPGGAIGQRYGDKAAVLAGLALMLVGGLMMAFLTTWSGQIAGRLVTGTGGVIISVLMTKMLADWFADREISTAMAIFVNSWPVGIAASLVILPAIGSSYGLSMMFVAVSAFVVIAMLLVAQFYEAATRPMSNTTTQARLDRNAVVAEDELLGRVNEGVSNLVVDRRVPQRQPHVACEQQIVRIMVHVFDEIAEPREHDRGGNL